ncbi:MAG: hypothetical protein CR217_16665 [Beijerinckiaceae bacterium]|nr:MAG: hypothetical protein CR217_16665 [Beijerinckiaceae bacterium]
MTEYFYRYRPIKAVLDEFHELENQEIYFSTTDEFNDPMEGFKDLFWRGDEIVWRNFLKHYILCTLQTANYCFIAADQFDPNILRNIVFWVPQELPEAPIREIYQRVSAEFLEEPAVKTFLSLMAARTSPVRRRELTSYLRALSGFALLIVLKEYRERGLLPPLAPDSAPPPREKLRSDATAMMEGVTKITSAEYPPERISEALFAANEATVAQVMLINEYNLPDRDKQMPMVFLSSRFPVAYVAALDRLVHRDWSVACFTKTAENHSMWSTYANGHRGVCLMFKTTPNETGVPALVIERVTGVSGTKEATTYISSEVSHEFNAVRYMAQYPAIDFFRSLGSISEMHMNNFWYRGDNGAFSECRDAVYADHDAWRKGYWQTFGESTLYKTPEWAHEEEYRIVAHSGFDMSDPIKRKLKYRFEDLAGIVFGARTDIEDKLKIMRIIDAKCARARRSDFKFFEVRYLHTESRFQLFALDLLKIQYS